jgi:3-phosphoshikimate 1-carboxyvinyltransferase
VSDVASAHGRQRKTGFRDSGRPEKGFSPGQGGLNALLDIDQDLLRLVARRSRILQDLPQGRERSRLERTLRSSWEAAAGRISRDPQLVRRLFALLQTVQCLPRPRDNDDADEKTFFILSPNRRPLDVDLLMPIDGRLARYLIVMAAISNRPCLITGVMFNDSMIELIKGFNQLNPTLRWEEGRLSCVPDRSGGLGDDKLFTDRALHIGNDRFNFLLLLFAMAVRPCRLKIMGDSDLKLADLSFLRRFLPSVGARFTSIVPGQDGLPARLEASGILPEVIRIPASLETDAVMSLCVALACSSLEHAVEVRFEDHGDVVDILGECGEIFAIAGAAPQMGAASVLFPATSDPLSGMPGEITLTVDRGAALSSMLTLAFAGGRARIIGLWPDNPPGRAVWRLLEHAGLRLERNGTCILAECPGNVRIAPLDDALCRDIEVHLRPFLVLLAAHMAITQGEGALPACLDDWSRDITDDFLSVLGVTREGSRLRPVPGAQDASARIPWSSPDAFWAIALALAAFDRPGLNLLNPGIVTSHMAGFWKWYNGLPNPTYRRPDNLESAQSSASPPPAEPPPPPPVARRRIRTPAMAENQTLTPAPERE